MLRVLFFGRFREELDCAELNLVFSENYTNLQGLQDALIAERGDQWLEVLAQENVIRAVNQEVATQNVALSDGDEIAFFPPVTGG
ncbi:MoaD/ThiS family protein [Halieaceae bacterium IMCC8485]|jgi:molybdopterin converting factor subunit 1|uniref:Molybdopterin synthase sulfur carrier subunit n=1 Tax=Candidatus Seongchinamella marina TaxID=2518990 RepID=A0ABT3STF4_9GAMM|nr:MoaD/ThiS family protein [Candidatus Seongchinamella marina]MCX2973272.1 MoaD/ThiS family protein [Candidatus Seongchinamella marina]